MPSHSELFNVATPAAALAQMAQAIHGIGPLKTELVPTHAALGRTLAADLFSPEDLPNFRRSSVDGYAVNAADTHGASPGLPALLTVVGEAPMGKPVNVNCAIGECVLVHTGSMIPHDTDAVVMVEHTQKVQETTGIASVPEIEVLRAVAMGDNVVQIGEDVRQGQPLLSLGHTLRAQDIGGLLALGIVDVAVCARPRVAIISTGDEVVPPSHHPQSGQVRDVNAYTLSARVSELGGEARRYGIVPDHFDALLATATRAKAECDIVVLSAGSSVSTRDMSVDVINQLGQPGVLVHGVSVKPGKPTIIAVCDGVPILGLPGNPTSALVMFNLFVAPAMRLLMRARPSMPPQVQAKLTRNIPSTTGREDYVAVTLEDKHGELLATPVFGKSNLIYTLIHAQGTVQVPLDLNGFRAGELVTVML
jgi:molybdopterin molybdotransferase